VKRYRKRGSLARCASGRAWVRSLGSILACLTGFSPIINLQVLGICSLTRGCTTMVRVTCPSRAKPGRFRISLSHVQPLCVGVGLACALGCVCEFVCVWWCELVCKFRCYNLYSKSWGIKQKNMEGFHLHTSWSSSIHKRESSSSRSSPYYKRHW
jgi:hypothetical protein